MNIQQRKQAVHDMANELCSAQNQFTNLELKNKLRKKFPNEIWNQTDISAIMINLSDEDGYFDYIYNGSHRIYFASPSLCDSQAQINSNPPIIAQLIADMQSISIPNAKPVKVKTPLTTKRIGRNKALEIIQNTKGKFFSVKFTKKNSDKRLMGVQYAKCTKADPLGYVRLKELKTQVTKSINLQTLSEIKANNILYKIK